MSVLGLYIYITHMRIYVCITHMLCIYIYICIVLSVSTAHMRIYVYSHVCYIFSKHAYIRIFACVSYI